MVVDAVTPVILNADTEVADKDRKAVKALTARVLEIMGGGKHRFSPCEYNVFFVMVVQF
jgi:hypothetical protein